MAEKKTHTCGSNTVIIYDWDDSCLWSCICDSKGCSWTVHCGGKLLISGSGKPKIGSTSGTGPTIQVDGKLGMIAKVLQERWGRRLTVADGQEDQRIKRTVKGTRKQIADGLGLTLGPKL